MGKGEEEEKVKEVITAVYKVNLHCPQCASQIRRPLLRTQGVHEVDANIERNEIKVKGRIDSKKIHERIKRLIKREVEMVAPTQAKTKVAIATEKTTVKETKEVGEQGKAKNAPAIEKVKEVKEHKLSTTTLKVHMHCETCGHDLRRLLIKRKGIYSVKTDMKAQTLTVEGIVEPNKLQAYIQKKVRKHAEIVIPKAKEDEKKKETIKVEVKSSTEGKKMSEEFKEGNKENVKVEAKAFVEEKRFKEKEAGLKNNDGSIPYFVHYVYAPQLFSDENPNACSIM